MLAPPPPPIAPAAPRPGEVADEVRRAATWLADVDLDQLGGGQLLGLVEALAPVLDRLTITMALALGRAEARDATIDADGLLPDAWLQLVSRRTGADRRTLLCAGQVLPTLPRLCEAAVAGEVSWSEVRVTCLRAVRLSTDDRRQLDLHLAADRDALQAMTPAEVLDQLPSPPDRPDEPRWRTRGHRQALALHRLVAADGDDRPGTSAQLLVTVEDPAGTPDGAPSHSRSTTDDTRPEHNVMPPSSCGAGAPGPDATHHR